MTDETRVRNGATFLDVHRPGWASEIDQNTLNNNCVLAQLYDCDYVKGFEELGLFSYEARELFGFTWAMNNERVNALWKQEIARRLSSV